MNSVMLHELASGKPDAATFLYVAPATGFMPSPPDFLFGCPQPDVLSGYFTKHVWLHAQGVWRLPAATIHFPYLVELDGTFINSPWANMHASHVDTLIAQSSSTPPVCIDCETPHVLVSGPGYGVFGHWLVDFLPKLVVLEASGYRLSDLRFLLPHDAPEFAKKLLSMCGVSAEQLVTITREHSLRTELLIPTTCHNGVRGPKFKEVAAFMRRRLGLTIRSPTRRVFVARPAPGPGSARGCINGDMVQRVAEDHGFEAVRPEKLTLDEQIELFADAKFILGEYGSALHWSLVSEPGAVVCALRGSRAHPGFIQSAIGRALGQPTGYVFGQSTESGSLDNRHERFEVPERPFLECLEYMLRGFPLEPVA